MRAAIVELNVNCLGQSKAVWCKVTDHLPKVLTPCLCCVWFGLGYAVFGKMLKNNQPTTACTYYHCLSY